MNSTTVAELASKHFGRTWDVLTEHERSVLRAIVARSPISRPVLHEMDADRTRGQRVADRVASFGGSWTFIGLFFAFILVWMGVNTLALLRPYDPYPYILLNLILSCIAAIQAPIILMSQTRQGEKDRQQAKHDYEINLKAEIEIMQLHDKIELLKTVELTRLLQMQEAQGKLFETLLHARNEP